MPGMDRPARVALALGSGGARGYAHIGVISVLVERGYQIVSVAGSSMGALVGGLHAAGKLDDYAEWARGLGQVDVLRFLDPVINAPGAIRANKILARMTELLDGTLIEDLPIPYTAVATDLLAGREVWLQSGPVEQAIRASIAIPGLMTPVSDGGRVLADGGLLNPIPVSAAAVVPADLVIAVSLAGDRQTKAPSPDAGTAAAEPWINRIRSGAAQALRPFTPTNHDDQGDADAARLNLLDVMSLSLDAMQSALERYHLAGFSPDVLISVPKSACRTIDFHKAAELIEVGREQANCALDFAGLP
jgi:NTE family protein